MVSSAHHDRRHEPRQRPGMAWDLLVTIRNTQPEVSALLAPLASKSWVLATLGSFYDSSETAIARPQRCCDCCGRGRHRPERLRWTGLQAPILHEIAIALVSFYTSAEVDGLIAVRRSGASNSMPSVPAPQHQEVAPRMGVALRGVWGRRALIVCELLSTSCRCPALHVCVDWEVQSRGAKSLLENRPRARDECHLHTGPGNGAHHHRRLHR